MKVLVGSFNQEKALVRAFSVIMKSSRTFVSSSNGEGGSVGVIMRQVLIVQRLYCRSGAAAAA